jgi:hypothetical protein
LHELLAALHEQAAAISSHRKLILRTRAKNPSLWGSLGHFCCFHGARCCCSPGAHPCVANADQWCFDGLQSYSLRRISQPLTLRLLCLGVGGTPGEPSCSSENWFPGG